MSLALLLCGCIGPDQDDASGQAIYRGLSGEPESLDPHRISSDQAASVLRDIGEGLISYSPDGLLVGGASDHWEVSDDGRVITFHIRDSAKWSNGEATTAHDFVYSLRRLVNPATAAPYAGFMNSIVNAQQITKGDMPPESLGVTALDDRTLRVHLDSPVPYLLQLLTHPSTFPVYRDAVEEHGNEFMRAENAVTNGAYRLSSWRLGSTVSLVRNENYWNNKETFFDQVTWVSVKDDEETNMFRAGELDTTGSVASSLFRKVQEEHSTELKIGPGLGTYFYGFNLNRPVFSNNPELRMALSLAIDREVLVEKITGRGERAAFSWVPPGLQEYTGASVNFEEWPLKRRHDEARRLYSEAGYGPDNPLKFELRYDTSDLQQQVALAIQGMWKQVLGAEVTLVNEEFRVLVSNIQQGDVTDVFRLSWTADYSDPSAFLDLMRSDSPSNFMSYSNEEFDQMLVNAASEPNSRARMSYLERAEKIVLDDHPVIPIYFHVNKNLVSSEISGWHHNVMGIHYTKDLQRTESK
jgi:ABC-type oligopeptide transport system substrate-binding subunit